MSNARTKKSAILEAAIDLLVEAGGAKLTMRKVAERAGLSLGNLQYHFPTRDALMAALLDHFLEQYEASLAGGAAPSGELAKDLERQFLVIFTGPQYERCSAVFKALWAEAQHNPEMKVAMDAYYKRLTKFYMVFFADVAGLPPKAPELKLVVSMLVPMLEGYCITGNVMGGSVKALAKNWSALIADLLGT